MTPETQAAAERVRAYLDAHEYVLGDLDQIAECGTHEHTWAPLTVTDLRVLLAALDPAEQPIPLVPTQHALDYLAIRRQQNPKTATP